MTIPFRGADCRLCPRLAEFLDEARAKNPDWHNAPVNGYGPVDARMMIIGLAPGMRGANRTGRPFTGDFAGDYFFRCLTNLAFPPGRINPVLMTVLNFKISGSLTLYAVYRQKTNPLALKLTRADNFLLKTLKR